MIIDHDRVWKMKASLICVAAFFCIAFADPRFRRATQSTQLVTAFVGSRVTLTCDITLAQFDYVEWRHNGSADPVVVRYQNYENREGKEYAKRVSLTNMKNLQIAPLKSTDGGVYSCRVTNSKPGTSATGSPVELVVYEKSALTEAANLPKGVAPRCDESPPGFFVAKIVGSTVLLPCKVVGNPFPQIQWSKNDGVLPKGRYAITDKGLTINSIRVDDAGFYQVTLRSSAGTNEIVIQLIVKTSASVLPGHYIDAVENQMASIPCGLTKVTKDSSISWKKNKIDPTKNSRFTLNPTTGSLVINRVNRRDAGSYNCTIMFFKSGQLAFKINQMYFDVQYPPEIIYTLPEESAIINENVSLPCVAVGNPAANVTWTWNGRLVKNHSRFEIGPNGSLIIENVTRKDEGVFTCTPFNKWKGDTKTTKLSIFVPPKFLKKTPMVYKVRIGENVSFDCTASGFPKPNITWYRHEKPVETSRKGVKKILNIQFSDNGKYDCVASSIAGSRSRIFFIFLVGLPYKPVNITTNTTGKSIEISWHPDVTGIIVQDFQLWHRPLAGSDFDWKFINFRSGNDTADFTKDVIKNSAIRIRGKNSEGFGPFSNLYAIFNNGSSVYRSLSIIERQTPLVPYNVHVNISGSGYTITWNTKFAPGRPNCSHYIIETKYGNGSWFQIGGNISKNAKQFILHSSDIKLGVLYMFRIYAVGTRNSVFVYPKVNYFGMPESPTSPAANPGALKPKSDRWPIYILAIILSVFFLVLVVSLICYLRATKRLAPCGKRRERDESLLNDKAERNGLKSAYADDNENGIKISGNKAFYKKNSKQKKPFHFDNCPIKLISDYEHGEHQQLLSQTSAHVIFSESPEKCQCDHRRCMTMPRKPMNKVKKSKKVRLYKSASSPSVITSTNGKSVIEHDLTTETVIDQDAYDLYDSEDDDFVDSKFPTIDRKFSSMKNSKMIDSYDQFCRSPSDFGSKDFAASQKAQKPKANDIGFYISDFDDNRKQEPNSPPESERISHLPLHNDDSVSPTESSREKSPDIVKKSIEKLESQVEIPIDHGTPDQGSKENIFDDPNDASSENSVTESDQRLFALTSSRLRHPTAKPGYAIRKSSFEDQANDHAMNYDRGLSAIKEASPKASLNSVDKNSLRSYELRSSGIESDSKRHSSFSDTESVINSIPPVTTQFKLKDIDVMSDISTRSSPGPLRRTSQFNGYDEPYEFDVPKHRTYGRPLYDSPKKDKYNSYKDMTDNEDLFRSIMKMQQQLGVDLADSWENLSEDTNISLACNSKTPLYRDGYASDVPSSFTDRVSSYTDREKTRRCAELLKELKLNKSNDATLGRTSRHVKRSQSAVSDYMRTAPIIPTYQRSNSSGENESVFHEWLV